MIKIAFCDDELYFLEHYLNVMECLKSKFHFELHRFTSGEELIKYLTIHDLTFNLIFLDIMMEQMNGIDTAKKIREIDPEVEIVFLTSTPEFALASYEIKAFNYIMKQSDQFEQKLIEAIEHADVKKKDYLIIVNKSVVEKVEINKIIFIESHKRKVIIHTVDATYEMYEKLDKLEEKLKNNKFVRTHRSYLLNMSYVKRIDNKEILTTHQHVVPISRGRADEIKAIFMKQLEI